MDFNDVERDLIEQLNRGKPVVRPKLNKDDQPLVPGACDPRAVPSSARIRGAALAAILRWQVPVRLDLTRGVRIAGYWIDDGLDLSRAHRLDADRGCATVGLVCEDCHIDGIVDLAGAHAGSLALRGTAFAGFTARGAEIDLGLTLETCLVRAPGPAGDHADDDRHGRSPRGRIDLDGCTVGGDLNLRRLRVLGATGDMPPSLEIDADNARINGSVDLGGWAPDAPAGDDGAAGRRPALYANFDNADIFGDFAAVGVWFARPSGHGRPAPWECLDLRGAQVRGDLCLQHIQASGRIRLEDADVAQDLELGGARLVQPRGVALDAQGLVVHGSVHLVDRKRELGPSSIPDPRLAAYGQLRFARSRIGGDFDASGATVCAVDVSIEGVAIDLRSAEFGGSVYLDGRRDVGPGFFVGLINMIQVRVGGSIVLSGSWFRAPCGQMMGPERIDAELYSEAEMRFALAERDIEVDLEEGVWHGFSVADVYYGHEDGLWPAGAGDRGGDRGGRVWHSPVAAFLKDLGIYHGLAYTARNLWRLRGGCRAIALEDARVGGAVLFGTAIDMHEPAETAGVPDPDSGNGPSVVIGAVDMDRARIDGELRLTGGIFRAVTPVVERLDELAAVKPVDDGADVSLSYPSTVGWTELMARTCLTLRGAQVGGRLDTRFFGALPPNVQTRDAPAGARLDFWRRTLNLIPEDAEGRELPAGGWLTGSLREAQRAAGYASEMLHMLAYVSGVERVWDHAFGASRPHVPEVQDTPGCYHLRPDGRFDLSDARVAAINDHPCHGWPTSDGHLRVNGCTYDFISLDVEESRIDDPTRATETLDAIWYRENRHLSYVERTGRTWWGQLAEAVRTRVVGLGLWLYQALLAIPMIPGWIAKWDRFLFATGTKASRPRQPGGLRRHWLRVCMRRRENRYRRYARRSFKRRNDDRSRPAYRRIAWLEQQYAGADPKPRDFLPQPYETLCRVMRANGYREDADVVAAAKRRQRCRATLGNPVLLVGENFLRWTSNYGYAPVRVVWVSLFVVLFGSATVQLAAEHDLLVYETFQTEGVAVMNAMRQAENPKAEEVPPPEDLTLDPMLFAIDRFIPLVELGYSHEWKVNEWVQAKQTASDGAPSDPPTMGEAEGGSTEPTSFSSAYMLRGTAPEKNVNPWRDAVASLLCIDVLMACEKSPESSVGVRAWAGEVLRVPIAAVAWIIGGIGALIQGWGTSSWGAWTALLDFEATVAFWSQINPENTIRWLGAIYHALGWALFSMAIVTFTGVMRRD